MRKIGLLMGSLALLPGAGHAQASRYAPYPAAQQPSEGLSWPKGQALPIFAAPAEKLDTIVVQALSKDEQITFSALQGQVNRKQPRILLLDERSGEGRDTWPKTLKLGMAEPLPREAKWDLVKKYAGEVTGVVLYDPSKNPHFRNLAGTAAGIQRALPVTREVMADMKAAGIDLKVVEDLTGLDLPSPMELYAHMHKHYWPKCDRRVIVNAKPHDQRGGGDYHHTRDIAAATGAAVVWLDTQNDKQRDVLRTFFRDMKAGDGIALGWYSTERTGIPLATEFGIGTLPADFFVSGSVYAGTDPRITVPPVPRMPALENKVYISVFISDGDNIQYVQHAMRQAWDGSSEVRGKVPLNWTIAPGLVDIAPGMLNYYYAHATSQDCFVTGPSGMGYLMPVNTLTEPGAPIGPKLTEPARMDGYSRMTETYLQRSGLRVATIWDDMTPMQRASYEKHCRNLYGATVQNFKDVPEVAGGVQNGRLRFDKLVIPYAGSNEHMHGTMVERIREWDGKSPLFLSYQVEAWKMRPERVLALQEQLEREYPGKISLVRADHYFNLMNQAEGVPYNLCLAPETVVKAGAGDAALAMDGSPSTHWSTAEKDKRWLGFDFGAPKEVRRYVIRHAGDGGAEESRNSRAFTIQSSMDGKSWKQVHKVTGNLHNVTDIDLSPVKARYFKVTIDDAGADSTARIAEVEIFGIN
ncbi:GxGYxYP family putative glycoside hydrolase [Luteolibacter flavescens]|uniref:GxGYxYP family putative glycoside hydrolase n=1 Tax=Luteolibacter flavescens TaxID=1859460 RepID=A0ABT3FPZ6_9BACT|nr:discoidin domain-containing protein [Luteolibacter flavescens]MCW1885658.1 GxGYxYP family putative glycoside hydrolase [Luteolibacter flavescens]